MQKIEEQMRAKAVQLMQDGAVECVLAWRAGEFDYDNAPALYSTAADCKGIVYNDFCPANLAKYLMQTSKQGKKTAIFAKPCDTYGINQLLKDNRVKRENIYVIGTPCRGMLDYNKIKALAGDPVLLVEAGADEIKVGTLDGEAMLKRSDVLLAKCTKCKGSDYMISDEELGEKLSTPEPQGDKLAEVKAIEAMSPTERFAFWQNELSKCIRCNACRDICPACNCEQCIFDKPDSPVAGKAYADEVEEQLFHIIRAYHVAGRCTGCGECARVCPQGVRIDLLNSKFAKDINTFFGPYQAGADSTTPAPLVDYSQTDGEANTLAGGAN